MPCEQRQHHQVKLSDSNTALFHHSTKVDRLICHSMNKGKCLKKPLGHPSTLKHDTPGTHRHRRFHEQLCRFVQPWHDDKPHAGGMPQLVRDSTRPKFSCAFQAWQTEPIYVCNCKPHFRLWSSTCGTDTPAVRWKGSRLQLFCCCKQARRQREDDGLYGTSSTKVRLFGVLE